MRASIAPQWYRKLVQTPPSTSKAIASIAPQWYRKEPKAIPGIAVAYASIAPQWYRKFICFAFRHLITGLQLHLSGIERYGLQTPKTLSTPLQLHLSGIERCYGLVVGIRTRKLQLHLSGIESRQCIDNSTCFFSASIAPQWYRKLLWVWFLYVSLSGFNCTSVV